MEEKIRILAIAPYEGMQFLLNKVAQDYPQIQMDVLVGDLQQGVEAAQNNFHADYDVILSRGGTAQLLREQVSLPVIEIPITELDIMRALRLADNVTEHPAIVGFPNITSSAQTLCDLLSTPIKIFTVHNSSEVKNILEQVQAAGFQTIVCDMIANTSAKQIGLNSVLITSGTESLQQAFQKVLMTYRNIRRLQAENHFLRQVIYEQSTETVVYDAKKSLYFSTVDADNRPAVLNMLKSEIDSLDKTAPCRIVKSLDGILYTIKGQHISSYGQEYTIFYFTRSKAPLPANKCGIKYYTCQEAIQHFVEGFFSSTGAIADLEKDIEKINQSPRPVAIIGEEGTGKDPVATAIYTRSSLKNHPFVSINCALLNDKTREYLLSSHNSPFTQSNTTLYISEIHALTQDQQSQLLAALTEMDVCRRNKVILGCVLKPGGFIREGSQNFIDRLSCLTLNLAPLRLQADKIPLFINMYLGQLNVSLAREILGMEPNAIKKMQEFPWPHNFSQFKRVLMELVTMCDGNTVTLAAVEKVLSLEVGSPLAESTLQVPERFDLNRSLEEMNKEIVKRVLEENDGNQSAAAKQLGISRTTMWRYCKM